MSFSLFNVKDKVVVITGGLGQLGRQFSLTLLDQRAKVAVFDDQMDKQRVIKRLGERRKKENLMLLPVDVTQKYSVEHGTRRVTERWGVPHALVYAAALDSPPNAPFST